MNASKILKDLNIDKNGTFSDDNCYVIDLDDSKEFFKIYSILDKSELLEADDDLTLMDADESYIVYDGDDYQISLIADLEADTYRIVLKEI